MKIAVDIRHLAKKEYSGVDYYTVYMLRALINQCPEHEFFLFSSGRKEKKQFLPKFDAPNVFYRHIPLPNKILNILLIFYIINLDTLLKKSVDLWLFPNISIIKTKKPYLITAHDLSFEFYPDFFSLKQRIWHKLCRPQKLFKQAKQVFAVSESTKKDLENIYQISNVSTNLLSVEDQMTDIESSEFPDHYFLFIGTNQPRKNLRSAIDAFLKFQKKYPDYHFLIAGAKGWKSKNQIDHSHIHFLGYIDENTKNSLLKNAKALIFPSFYEGFGLPIVEALQNNIPIITSFTSSMPEIAKESAIYIDPYQKQDLYKAMVHIISPEMQQLFRQKKSQIVSTLTWENHAKKIAEYLF